MPIPLDEWRELIKGSLLRLSDGEYQSLAWFNKHAEQTSPDEQICQILGDYGFEDFIRSHEIGLTFEQQRAALALAEKLKKFGGIGNEPLNPYAVMTDPEWASVRADSKKVLNTLFPI